MILVRVKIYTLAMVGERIPDSKEPVAPPRERSRIARLIQGLGAGLLFDQGLAPDGSARPPAVPSREITSSEPTSHQP